LRQFFLALSRRLGMLSLVRLPLAKESGSSTMSKKDIKEIDRIVKEEGLSKGQRRLLHEEITGQTLSLDEIREIARQIKELHPNK
jgi:hypothetical protein